NSNAKARERSRAFCFWRSALEKSGNQSPKTATATTRRRAFIRRHLIDRSRIAMRITIAIATQVQEVHVIVMTTQIRISIGGWTFEPWRGTFYPKGLPKTKELAYASEHLTSIEVNGTFYRTQSPATYRKWASEVPDGFMFSIKAIQYATNRRVLAEAGDSVK